MLVLRGCAARNSRLLAPISRSGSRHDNEDQLGLPREERLKVSGCDLVRLAGGGEAFTMHEELTNQLQWRVSTLVKRPRIIV